MVGNEPDKKIIYVERYIVLDDSKKDDEIRRLKQKINQLQGQLTRQSWKRNKS